MSPTPPSLKTYRLLVRRLPAETLFGRLAAVIVASLALPALALLALAFGRQGIPLQALFMPLLVMALAGIAALLTAYHLLAPFRVALHALQAHLKSGDVLPVATDLDGDTGHLLQRLRKLIERSAEQRSRLDELTSYDPLTGLPGRHSAADYLRLALSLAERSEQKFSVALLELDSHRVIRENLGPEAAQRALSVTGEFLRMRLKRRTDWVGRWTDSSFITVVISDPRSTADYLDDLCAEFARQMRGFEGIGLNLNAGLTDLRPNDNTGICIGRAQVALDSAKQEGRHRVVAHLPTTLQPADTDDMLSCAFRGRAVIP